MSLENRVDIAGSSVAGSGAKLGISLFMMMGQRISKPAGRFYSDVVGRGFGFDYGSHRFGCEVTGILSVMKPCGYLKLAGQVGFKFKAGG